MKPADDKTGIDTKPDDVPTKPAVIEEKKDDSEKPNEDKKPEITIPRPPMEQMGEVDTEEVVLDDFVFV